MQGRLREQVENLLKECVDTLKVDENTKTLLRQVVDPSINVDKVRETVALLS